MKFGSGNHTHTLKRANNEHTGDTIVTGKGGNEKYAEGHEAIFGKQEKKARYIGMNYSEKCSPFLTQCPRCNNPYNKCDSFVTVSEVTDLANGSSVKFSASQEELLSSEPDVLLYGGCGAIFWEKKDAPLTSCAAHQDGDCSHKQCPQLRDDEPNSSGRSCPLWVDIDND